MSDSSRAKQRPRVRGGRVSSSIVSMVQTVRWIPMVLGLLLMAVSVLGVRALTTTRGAVTQIWVAADELEADEPLAGWSVEVVTIQGAPAFPVMAVADWDRDSVVELVPRLDVASGSPLAESQFYGAGEFVAPGDGMVAVAVAVDRLHIPSGLEEGATVELVGVPDSLSSEKVDWPGQQPVVIEALVLAISVDESISDATVTVAVDRESAANVIWLAGERRIAFAEIR